MSDWLPLGTGQYVIRGDALFWKVSGEITKADVRKYAELISKVHEQQGYALLFADATAGVSVASTARREFTDSFRDRPTPSHVIVVGGSPMIRALASLVKGGAKLVLKRQIAVDFHDTEAAALRRLDAVRELTRKAMGR